MKHNSDSLPDDFEYLPAARIDRRYYMRLFITLATVCGVAGLIVYYWVLC